MSDTVMNHETCDHSDIDRILAEYQGKGPLMFRWVFSDDEADYTSRAVWPKGGNDE